MFSPTTARTPSTDSPCGFCAKTQQKTGSRKPGSKNAKEYKTVVDQNSKKNNNETNPENPKTNPGRTMEILGRKSIIFRFGITGSWILELNPGTGLW